MTPFSKRAVTAVGAVAALGLAACSGGGGSTPGASGGATSAVAAGAKGGTLQYVTFKGSSKWDPNVIYIGAHIEFANRVFARTLTTFKPGDKLELAADMATDTGKSLDGGKAWEFTLRDGLKWEDGQEVKCEDVKYGLSKTFDAGYAGGPQYAKQFLDVPKVDGKTTYEGPYKGTAQADFDKSIVCDGKKITFKLNQPVADFNWAVTMTAFAAARKDKDQGKQGWLNIFSNGPYKLEGGKWDPAKGGTFVRNDNWDPKSDTLRKALPDKIVWTQGIDTALIYDRLIADAGDDKNMVTDRSAPAAKQAAVLTGPAKDRTINPSAPYVDYLSFNMKRLTNLKVRQAFQIATDRDAYIAAGGGPTTGTPATGIINPDVKGYKKFDPFQGAPAAGDPAKAKALLTEAGVPMPVAIKVVYPQTPTADKAFSAMKAKWDQAGFNVTIEAQPDTDYYGNVQDPTKSKDYDVMWAGWGADWPAASTVIPPLFDSRINLTSESNGSDYGQYDDAETNKMIDAALATADLEAQAKLWGDLDERIVKTQAAAVPLQVQKFIFTRGSNVKGFQISPGLGGFVDMATIAVQ